MKTVSFVNTEFTWRYGCGMNYFFALMIQRDHSRLALLTAWDSQLFSCAMAPSIWTRYSCWIYAFLISVCYSENQKSVNVFLSM